MKRRLSWLLLRRLAVGAAAGGAFALGACAIGALAIGAVAVGAIAIGRLRIGKGDCGSMRIGRLQIGELDVPQPPAAAIPYLCVRDAVEALAFYRAAFDASIVGEPVIFEGKIGHAELRFDTARFFLSDEFPEIGVRSPAALGACTASTVLVVADVDAATERARRAGAAVAQEPSDQPYGRTAKLLDPFGQRWILTGA